MPKPEVDFSEPKLKLKKESKSGNDNAKKIPNAINHFHSFRKAIITADNKNKTKSGQKNNPNTLTNMKTPGLKWDEAYDKK
jgi:hypothetical protein